MKTKRRIKKSIIIIVTVALIGIAAALYALLRYKKYNFENVGVDELVFLLFSPTGGNLNTFQGDTLNVFIQFLSIFAIMSLPVIVGYYVLVKRKSRSFSVARFEIHFKRTFGVYMLSYSLLLFFAIAIHVVDSLDLVAYYRNSFASTDLYDSKYIEAEVSDYTVPEQKRNLIVIYMESMETSLESTENGGASVPSKIPELEALATDSANVSFSNTDKLGGAQPVPGTTWTVAGLTAMNSGLPLSPTASLDANDFNLVDEYMPGTYMLGDVLRDYGYNQTIVMGSDASFGGRDKLFSQHGDYEIIDLEKARSLGYIANDYEVWWGYEDRILFDIAKDQLNELSKSDQPFNFQMLTADTHFTDGYLDDDCPTPYDDQYSNVYACSSARIAEFVNWAKQQSFYANTTIVLVGDHLGMQTSYYDGFMPENYTRTTYNAFINTPKRATNEKNRTFTSLDLYPTILSSINITTSDDQLGLGTDLFSKTPTISETMGLQTFYDELSKQSDFYTTIILGL